MRENVVINLHTIRTQNSERERETFTFSNNDDGWVSGAAYQPERFAMVVKTQPVYQHRRRN